MIKFILFFKRIHFVLIFIILEALAVNFYANSTSYTRAKMVTASNRIAGGIHARISGVLRFIHLGRENERLTGEIAELRNRYGRFEQVRSGDYAFTREDSLIYFDEAGKNRWEYYPARVVNNSIIRQNNFITINKGVAGGISPDMALVSGNSIVGYVLSCTDNFSICMSVLNRDFKTGGRIKNGEYFGTVFWDGIDYEHVTLSEVPKYAEVKRGDTILTSSHSLRFPPDLMVGTVEEFELVNATYYDIKVKLDADMGAIDNVIAIKNLDYDELNSLEQSVQQPY